MSTQSLPPHMWRSSGRFIFALLVGATLALQCLLPSVASARAGGQTAVAPSDPNFVLDKVGVSVVRLAVTYSNNGSGQPAICTGLGIMVGSTGSTGSLVGPYQNWVLTDAKLISPLISNCETPGTTYTLQGIQIFASDKYTQATSTAPVFYTLGQLSCTVSGTSINSCEDENTPTTVSENMHVFASNQCILFSFQSATPQPYLSPEPGSVVSPISTIGLTDAAKNPFSGSRVTGSTVEILQNFLAPTSISLNPGNPASSGKGTATPVSTQASKIEAGTPVVDGQGNLTAMYLSSNEFPVDISALKIGLTDVHLLPGTTDPASLKTLWDAGVEAYYAKQYAQADMAFKAILALNNAPFKAANMFDALALSHLHPANPPQLPPGRTSQSSGNGLSGVLLIAVLAGLAVLLLLLVLVTLLVGRAHKRRRELARFAAEQAEAQRLAEAEVQRQRTQKAQTSEAACPNCQQAVHLSDTVCSHCRFPLAPSASGLHVRLAGSEPLPPVRKQTQPVPAVPSISEQPTIQFPPQLAAAASSEKTMKRKKALSPAERNGDDLQQTHRRNLSLAVGTRSDPGIKRKHKPNEDSLFAMQGARTHNSQPQQFGLFVVADGMGGHANGQDASRLAIQTMIDYMLPRISSSETLHDEAFKTLLGEGVQQANLAVNSRNVEAHADMGTTMTTALVVGVTAYVANVGDSRTYFYRDGQGLSRVTNDHSVVASLVEAGIIKPDDIYTHPKRNQIYRSLGEKPVVEVDTFQVDLQPGDKLLLCSDGLWDMVRDPVIQQVLGKPSSDPNKTGQELIKAALQGGGEDNVTVIVVQLAELNEPTGMTGVQLLAKPDTVTVPNLPPL